MKIILVGASGTIGKAVDAELGKRHEVVRVSRNSGDVQVDISDPGSIHRLYEQVVSSTPWSARRARSISAHSSSSLPSNSRSVCATN